MAQALRGDTRVLFCLLFCLREGGAAWQNGLHEMADTFGAPWWIPCAALICGFDVPRQVGQKFAHSLAARRPDSGQVAKTACTIIPNRPVNCAISRVNIEIGTRCNPEREHAGQVPGGTAPMRRSSTLPHWASPDCWIAAIPSCSLPGKRWKELRLLTPAAPQRWSTVAGTSSWARMTPASSRVRVLAWRGGVI